MSRTDCPRCGLEGIEGRGHCPRCGASLSVEVLAPPRPERAERAKAVRFFRATRVDDGDPASTFLRVSSYRREQRLGGFRGAIVVPGHHVRFSVWVGDRAVCALSLSHDAALELADFLAAELASSRPTEPDAPHPAPSVPHTT